jgi:hypothetical protein
MSLALAYDRFIRHACRAPGDDVALVEKVTTSKD